MHIIFQIIIYSYQNYLVLQNSGTFYTFYEISTKFHNLKKKMGKIDNNIKINLKNASTFIYKKK